MRRSPALNLRKASRHSEPCPRKALAIEAAAVGHSFAALSRMLGRRDGYLACFVREGHPAALNARDHRMLADHFGVEERALGIRELWSTL